MKFIEQTGDKELIIKTNCSELNSNLWSSKNDLVIDKNKYNELEYTKDYMNDLLTNLDKLNNDWNYLLNLAILYHKEINYKDTIDYTGVKKSIKYSEEPKIIKGKVNTNSDYLNVRSTPNGEIISNLQPGSEVQILENDNNGWTKISYNDSYAYVCSRYITSSVPLNVIDNKQTTTNITIRNYPNGQIINSVPSNTNIQILSENNNGWTKILYDNRIAFVDSNYLK